MDENDSLGREFLRGGGSWRGPIVPDGGNRVLWARMAGPLRRRRLSVSAGVPVPGRRHALYRQHVERIGAEHGP